VTLEDCAMKASHKSLLVESKNSLSTGMVPSREETGDSDGGKKCVDRVESPIRTQKNVSKSVHPSQPVQQKLEGGNTANPCNETIMDNIVYYSKVYKHHEVFPSLLQGLDVAYRYGMKANATHLPNTCHGDNLANRLFFRVSETSFAWVLSPKQMKSNGVTSDFVANAQELPRKKAEVFYFLGKVGEGSNGAVYLACDNSAHLCALKVYHIKPSGAAVDGSREVDEENQCHRRWAEAEEEMAKWKQIYPKQSERVRRLFLSGRPCLLIPYGVEIKDNEQRSGHLKAVKAELERIAEMNLCYNNNDIRWRHVLLDFNNKVFLADLGSLVEIPNNVSKYAVVEDQIKLLEKLVIK
jgi:hypothetical protein